jgi:hypothetical protein
VTGKHTADDRWPRILRAVSLAAVLALAAQSEMQLALAVGWPIWLAWCAPVALDAYVLAADWARRSLVLPVLVSTVSVLASHAVYASDAAWVSGKAPTGNPHHLVWQLAAVCSVVPLLVLLLSHTLLEHPAPAPAAQPVPTPVPTPLPAPEAAGVDAPAPAPVTEPVAQGAPAPEPRTREVIEDRLRQGPATVADLRELTQKSDTAIRGHLHALKAKSRGGVWSLPAVRVAR